MNKSIFKLSFFLVLSYNGIAQDYNSSVLLKKFDLNFLLIREKLIADSIISIYGDSATVVIKKLTSDTTFINSLKLNSSLHDNLICSAYKIPYVIKPLGWTSDYGYIFTSREITKLDSLLYNYEKKTTNEIVVVTFDTSFVYNEDFDRLVLTIHNLWHIGKMNKKNGILIGVSLAKRKIRISNADDIQTKLSDNETKRIIDDIMVPEFKKGNYFIGVQNAILEIIEKLKNENLR